MKRFLTRLLRIFISWGFLKFLLIVITLIVLLYAEEDWRGARAWAATKAKWEARGVSFDFDHYLPPPVPDDKNLAALPLFKLSPDPDPDPEMHGYLVPLALQQAIRRGTDEMSRSGLADWEAGKMPDIGKFRQLIAAQYAAAFPAQAAPGSALEQFAQLNPFVANLREASKTRPHFCIAQNYDFMGSPESSSLRLMTDQIAVSKFLTWDAALSLDAQKSDQALDDVKLDTELTRGLMDQPVLVAGLVAIGMAAINLGAVYDGLAAHEWSDAQLAQIQIELGRLDFLAGYPHDMRGECLLSLRAFDELAGRRYAPKARDKNGIFPSYYANGWIDLLKAQVADFQFTQVGYFDVNVRRVDAKGLDDCMNTIAQKQRGWTPLTLWNLFFGIAAGPVTSAAEKYSEMQVWVDEARIACALERYRLAHNAYPATLDALVPACIGDLPHDIMSGQPYHYRLNAAGSFLLYSVGWNQRDDGGIEVKEDTGPARDYAKGDWVWPSIR